jgi:hypothetical protein
MPLWGMIDANTSAPKNNLLHAGVAVNGNVLFDNVQVGAFHANLTIGVFGVDAREKSNTQFEGHMMTHAGWVQRTIGTGGVGSIAVTNGGKGYVNGFVTLTGGGVGNSAANASFTVRANGSIDNVIVTPAGAGYANGFLTITSGGSGNTPANISYTVNGTGAIVSTTIVNGGANYDTVPTVQALGANSAPATVVVTTNTGTILAVTVVTQGYNYTNTVTANVTTAYNAAASFGVTMNGRTGRRSYITLVAAGSMATDNTANADDAIVGA